MNQNYILMEYYIRYLKNVRKVKESSVAHYLQALRTVSKMLVEKGKVSNSIYEIRDVNELSIIKEYLYNEPDFINLDERGHRMYSAGLNNYFKFANGDGFSGVEDDMRVMDIEISKRERNKTVVEYWKRSSIIKAQSIKAANYKCEIDNEHATFVAKSTGEQYMEGHHAIPMKLQDNFDVSLDVYANVICLCPICHRLLHYGKDEAKETVMDKIYFTRADRLANSGIRLSRDEFKTCAI